MLNVFYINNLKLSAMFFLAKWSCKFSFCKCHVNHFLDVIFFSVFIN